MKNNKNAPSNGYMLLALFGGGIFLITTFLAIWGRADNLDLQWFEAIYRMDYFHPSYWFVVTQLGSIFALIIATVIAWIARKTKIALMLAGSGLISYCVCWVVKEIIARPRPYVLLPSIQSHDWSAVGYGYPSAHAAVTASIVFVLYPLVKKPYRPLLLIPLVMVALSRIFLGVHTPLDVIGGAAVGAGVVGAMEYFMNKKA